MFLSHGKMLVRDKMSDCEVKGRRERESRESQVKRREEEGPRRGEDGWMDGRERRGESCTSPSTL